MIPAHRLIRVLKKAGFVIIRQRGSHVALRHIEKNLTTYISQHPGNIKKGLFKAILKQAHISEDEFRKLL
ncbi:MAG: type II toxin-antitoxin system HicA family toxin [Patescibacteria group bacterium]